MKLSWEVLCKSDSLWVNVIQNKYKRKRKLHGTLTLTKKGSPLWCAMFNHFTVIEKATAWTLGNGRRVKFWLDN